MRITTSFGRKGWLLSSRWLIVSELWVGINSYRLLKPYGLAIIGRSTRPSRNDGADYGNFRLQWRIQSAIRTEVEILGTREARALIAPRAMRAVIHSCALNAVMMKIKIFRRRRFARRREISRHVVGQYRATTTTTLE